MSLIDTWFKFTSTHAGRDKWFRTTQYMLKYASWQVASAGGDPELAKKLKSWSKILSSQRKLFRIGKVAEPIVETYRVATSNNPDALRKFVSLAKQIATVLYYWYDMFQYLHVAKVVESPDKKALDRLRNMAWFIRIILNLLDAGLKYEAACKKVEKAAMDTKSDPKTAQANLRKAQAGKAKVVRTLMINSLDIWLPATSLKYIGLHEGQTGIIGTVSSLLGCVDKWPKK
jgi:peroxin-11B